MLDPNVQKHGLKWARKKVKQFLSNTDEHFNKMRDRFFFIDAFPENVSRFPLTHNDVIEKINV